MVPPPRVYPFHIPRENPSPVHEPVSHRTRSHTVSPIASASCQYPSDFLTEWALSFLDPSTGQYLKHRQLRRHPKLGPIWNTSYSNELGRLCQGVVKGPTSTGQCTKSTYTFRVTPFKNIPRDRSKGITFTKVVCKFRPEKEDPYRTLITTMGNRVVYAGDSGTKTASLDLCKIMMNIVISREGAKFITYDIRNCYLLTPLDYPKYVKINLTNIPQEFIDDYNLHDYVHKGWVYFEICNGVYGLPQSCSLANNLL